MKKLLILATIICCILYLSVGYLGAAQISEIRVDQTSTDNDEYFELSGTPSESLTGLTYLVIGDGTGGSGVIEAVVDLTGQTIPGSGYFVAAESTFTLGVADLTTTLNFENSDNVTHLLVDGFTGNNGDDLDTDDDGVLDVTPWTSIVDLIALIEEENPPSATEYHYGPPTVGPDGSYAPGHVFVGNNNGQWAIGPFDPASGADTPGAPNADAPATIFYLNFDDAADQTGIGDGTAYTIGASEVSRPAAAGLGSASFAFRNNGGDGPSIAVPSLASPPQGGKSLIVDSGSGQDEGLQITVANGLAKQSFTMEVIWYTNDASGGSNTAGIQSMCGDEWPYGEVSQFFIRTVNLGTNRMDYWTDRGDSDGEYVQVDPGGYAASTWHNDTIVFTYNSSDETNCQIEGFRDGVSVGTSVYNASSASVSLFGTAYLSNRTLAIGFHNSLDAGPGDHRGLNGAIDAFALSLGALLPGQFVLPSGATPITDWMIY